MTNEALDLLIKEIVIPQEKPKSIGNSHKRKQWENRQNWRRCTIRQTCKLGSLKEYEKLYQFYDRFNQWLGWVNYLQSEDRKLSYITYEVNKHQFKWVSYNSRYHRKTAARCVRRYKDEIANGGMYRKIYDYFQCCI